MHTQRFGESVVKTAVLVWVAMVAVEVFGQILNFIKGQPPHMTPGGWMTMLGGVGIPLGIITIRRTTENVTSTIKGNAPNGDGGGTMPPCPPPEQ